MSQKIKIAFVGGDSTPLINVKGGAIQTLVTALINENEKNKKLDIDLYTCYDPLLLEEIERYKCTKIIPIKKKIFQKQYDYFWKIIRKISMYHLESRSVFMNQVNKKISCRCYDYIIFESTVRQVREFNKIGTSKLCFHVHSAYIDAKNDQTKKVISKCDIMIGVSNFISKTFGVVGNTPNVITLKNAIDIDAFNQSIKNSSRKKIRKELGFEEHDTVVIFCGRLSEEKGCLELIKAIKKTNCKLLIVGGENFSSNKITPYTEKLKKEAYSLKERIVFTGYVQHHDIPKYLIAGDIGAVPSICDEAASLALVEMHAAGLPVVASNRGGMPEYASENNTIFVDTDECFIDNFAKSIVTLSENKDLYDEMKRNSRKELEKYSYSNYYKSFINLLEEFEDR